MPTEDELFSAVDALLEQVAQNDLPPPAERKRLRDAAGLSQAQIAKALDTRRETVASWESGRNEPRPPQRAAYARLLEKLSERFPAPDETSAPDPKPAAVAEAFAEPAPAPAPAPHAPAVPPPPPRLPYVRRRAAPGRRRRHGARA